MPSGVGNPQIQVRLHPDIMKKVEEKAYEMGFVTPKGKANLAEYTRFLIMKDINNKEVKK